MKMQEIDRFLVNDIINYSDVYYVIPFVGNNIYMLDKKTRKIKETIVLEGESEISENLFSDLHHVGDVLVLVPYNAQNLVVYDIKSGKKKYIHVGNLRFNISFRVDEAIVMVDGHVGDLYTYDIKEERMTQIDNRGIKILKKNSQNSHQLMFVNGIIQEKKIILPYRFSNALYIYDFETKASKVIELEVKGNLIDIKYNGYFYVLYEEGKIIKYNYEFKNNGELDFYRNRINAKRYPFRYLEIYGDKIYLLQMYNSSGLILQEDTNKCQELVCPEIFMRAGKYKIKRYTDDSGIDNILILPALGIRGGIIDLNSGKHQLQTLIDKDEYGIRKFLDRITQKQVSQSGSTVKCGLKIYRAEKGEY